MGKRYNTKIKRGQKIYSSKHNRYSPAGILAGVLLVVALFAAGWFLYPPIYNVLTGEHKVEPPSDQTSEATETKEDDAQQESQKDSAEPETPLEKPQSRAVKGEFINTINVGSKAQLEAKLAQLDSQEVNAVVVELKDKNGYIHYDTANEKAKTGEVVVASPFNLKEYVSTIKEKGFTPIAQIAAFKDPLAKQVDYEMAVKYNNTDISWLDKAPEYGGKSWINPYSTVAHDYIKGIIKEACEAGFETIMLTDVQFPNGYSMETATYPESGGTSKQQALKDFVAEAKGVAKELGAELYIYIEAPKALGMDTMVYGTNPLEIMGDDIVLGVMPGLLGNKIQVGADSIDNPVTTPYKTVQSILKAVELEDKNVIAMLQGYTAEEYKGSQNYLAYTPKEVEEQVKAVTDSGIEDYIVYK